MIRIYFQNAMIEKNKYHLNVIPRHSIKKQSVVRVEPFEYISFVLGLIADRKSRRFIV